MHTLFLKNAARDTSHMFAEKLVRVRVKLGAIWNILVSILALASMDILVNGLNQVVSVIAAVRKKALMMNHAKLHME